MARFAKSLSDLTLSAGEWVRFWSYVDKTPSGCWWWTGPQAGPLRYGRFNLTRRERYYAHRLAFRMLRYDPPTHLVIDHLCENRLCVNPDHLACVTSAENVLRGATVSGVNARKVACPSCGGSYSRISYGRRCKACFTAYNASYKAQHSERYRSVRSAYSKRNRKTLNAKWRDWYEANKVEYLAARSRRRAAKRAGQSAS